MINRIKLASLALTLALTASSNVFSSDQGQELTDENSISSAVATSPFLPEGHELEYLGSLPEIHEGDVIYEGDEGRKLTLETTEDKFSWIPEFLEAQELNEDPA